MLKLYGLILGAVTCLISGSVLIGTALEAPLSTPLWLYCTLYVTGIILLSVGALGAIKGLVV